MQAEISKVYPRALAMATGENLFSMQDARSAASIKYVSGVLPEKADIILCHIILRSCYCMAVVWRAVIYKSAATEERNARSNLIRYGGMHPETDVLQFDPALSYGLVEYLRTLQMLEENGWSRRRCVPHGAPPSAAAAGAR